MALNQQTARGSAQRSQHDGPRLPDRQGRDRRHPQAGHRRLHRRTRAYQSQGAGKQRIFRPRGRRHPVRALDCECVQVIGRKFVCSSRRKRKAPTPPCWQNENTALRRDVRPAPQRPHEQPARRAGTGTAGPRPRYARGHAAPTSTPAPPPAELRLQMCPALQRCPRRWRSAIGRYARAGAATPCTRWNGCAAKTRTARCTSASAATCC